MNIDRISLCQSENWIFNNLPRALDSDYSPIYDFKYPFSFELALDCERIVYKLKEHNINSEICRHLIVTLINDDEHRCSELIDFVAFSQSKMKFVNIAEKAEDFNLMTEKDKRRCLLDSICRAIMLVTNETEHDIVIRIINDVFESVDDTECVYMKKSTKRYDAAVVFTSSLKGYNIVLSVKNNITGKEKQTILFENGSYADLVYGIHKIIFKGKQCVIKPKDDGRNFDKPIVVDLF